MNALDNQTSLRSYQLIAEVGRGGMATVYLAAMRGPAGFNKLVVIKKTRKDIAIEGDVLAMFLDEARLSARMNHPNVVQTYEIGQDGNQYFIAMEYLDGQPYSRAVARLRQEMPLALHLRVIADLLAGLHHAHELKDFDGTALGVVHRDATPQNVFITYEGSIKVVDFGIAKALDAMAQTSTGVVKGKITYMSPEQARGEKLDRRTDVFAAGVMLWEAIARRRMWEGLPDVSVAHELMYDQVPPIAPAAPDVPEALANIVARALAPRREDRYATALDMRRDLEDWLARAGLHASARDVGEFIAPAFERDRKQVREVIEQQLRDLRWTGVMPLASSSDLPSIAVGPTSTSSVKAVPAAAPAPPSSTTAVSSPVSVADPPTGVPPPSFLPTGSGAALPMPSAAPQRSLAVPLLVAAAVALAVVAVGAVLVMRTGSTASAAPTAAASSPPSAAAPPAPTAVTLTVRAKPAEVRVYLDGVLLSTGPYQGKVAPSAAPRTVRVEAEHYIAKEEQVTLSSDVVLSFDLEKEAAAPESSAKKGASGVPHGGGVVRPRYGIEADSPYKR